MYHTWIGNSLCELQEFLRCVFHQISLPSKYNTISFSCMYTNIHAHIFLDGNYASEYIFHGSLMVEKQSHYSTSAYCFKTYISDHILYHTLQIIYNCWSYKLNNEILRSLSPLTWIPNILITLHFYIHLHLPSFPLTLQAQCQLKGYFLLQSYSP